MVILPIEIYGELDDEERDEVEAEVEYLEYLIKRYARSPADIFTARQRTKTRKYRRKAEEPKQYDKPNPYRTPK